MLQVLLVDDEPFVVQGLSVLIDWEKIGCRIAGTAANGKEALEFLEKQEADIIIADIKMPVMDGLELLKTVRKDKSSNPYFAILSGYRDFQFAQQAMRYGCTDYILKPVQKKELSALVNKVKQLCETEKTVEKAYLSRNTIAILSGKFDQENVGYVNRCLNLPTDIRYVSIEIDVSSLQKPVTENNMREIQRQMYQNCLNYLGTEYAKNCIFDVSGRTGRYDMGLLYQQSMADKKRLYEKDFLEELRLEAGKGTGAQAVMYAGCEVEQVSDLSKSYQTAEIARSFCTVQKDEGITYYEEKAKRKKYGQVLLKQILDELVHAVEQADKKIMKQKIEIIYDEMKRYKMNSETIDLNVNYLLFQLIHLALEQGREVSQSEVLDFIMSTAVDHGIIGGINPHLKEFVWEYSKYLSSMRQKSLGGPLTDVEKEIHERYMENLTLKELSAKYFVNSAYMGQLFKKKHGVSFREYLNRYRVDQAAVILVKTDKRVYEVAEMVGYRDLDYFINRFITTKGCTPAKYRKQYRE
ncbi:response regulator [Clostridium sp. E02]|uniref:response regulator transcription factor n=1 Tax=Clostridium sp. E02 TaxID=2487134 RepID=UPI000F522D61|nr:response regulator [Clostridium sp. E02]